MHNNMDLFVIIKMNISHSSQWFPLVIMSFCNMVLYFAIGNEMSVILVQNVCIMSTIIAMIIIPERLARFNIYTVLLGMVWTFWKIWKLVGIGFPQLLWAGKIFILHLGWNHHDSHVCISFLLYITVNTYHQKKTKHWIHPFLNKKDGLTRYGNSHVKDKTS